MDPILWNGTGVDDVLPLRFPGKLTTDDTVANTKLINNLHGGVDRRIESAVSGGIRLRCVDDKRKVDI